ncbi:MAG TPA: hypothetical protein VFS12_00495 [Terriglobia bacterium]|nr:hypothetical protein [Terriglobia bacterium]
MKHKKLLGRAKDLEARLGHRDCQSSGSRFRLRLAPAVDKKRNPTGYSESDDEDVPF